MDTTKSIEQKAETFDERFLIRTIIITLVVTGLIFLYGVSFNWQWAVIYCVISLLTSANFYLLYLIFKRLLFHQRKGIVLLLIFIKFFGIVGAGILFLVLFGFNLTAFLAGFNTLFLILILRVLGAQLFLKGK